MLLSLLTYGGLTSCTLGGLLAIVGVARGREARQLGAAVPVDNLADLKQLFALVPMLIAVTGRVLAPKPYGCEMSETEAAIVEMREEKRSERRVGEDSWVADSQVLRESVRETEWALGDGSRAELPVEGGRHAGGDYLQMSGDRILPEAQRSIFFRVAEQTLGSRPLGVRQVERCLPVGTMLTAVGELSTAVEHPSAFKGAVRRDGKMLVLRPPRDGGPFLLSRQPLPELIASLQSTSVACQQWATVFGAVGATMLLAAATQHAATWLRRRRMRRRVEKAMRERRAAAAAGVAAAGGGPAAAGDGGGAATARGGGGEGEAGAAAAAAEGEEGDFARGGLCVVCLERAPDMVFPSCGHLCTCNRCGGGLPRCPICRSRGRPIRVYTP